MKRSFTMRMGFAGLILLALAGCGAGAGQREVVLYTSQDSTYLSGFFSGFEEETGIRVKIRGDTEASKTVGLTQRLLDERTRPRADVFWNNEFANTLSLAVEGLLAPYDSPAAEGIPEAYRDPGRLWTGFAVRLRVFIVNNRKLGGRPAPTTWEAYLDPAWSGESVLARPLAGTTLTHVSALLSRRGEDATRRFLAELRATSLPLADGNSHVMRQVRDGRFTFGLTDTDDLNLALRESALSESETPAVAAAFPTGDTALVIPNTVALIKGAPHPEEARALIDFILSRETEARLAAGPSAQFPVRPDLAGPPAFGRLADVLGDAPLPDFAAIAARIHAATQMIEKELIR